MKSLRLVSTSVVVTCLLLVSLGCGQKTSNPFSTEYNGMGKVAEPEDSVEADGMTSGTKEHPWEAVLLEKRLSKAERPHDSSATVNTETDASDCTGCEKDSGSVSANPPLGRKMPKGKDYMFQPSDFLAKCNAFVWDDECKCAAKPLSNITTHGDPWGEIGQAKVVKSSSWDLDITVKSRFRDLAHDRSNGDPWDRTNLYKRLTKHRR